MAFDDPLSPTQLAVHGLGSGLRMAGAAANAPASGGSNFANNFADIAGSIRGITRNVAAGFARDPQVRQAAQAGLDQQTEQQMAQKRWILEMTFRNFENVAQVVAAHPGALKALTPYINKAAGNLRALGLPEENIQESINYLHGLSEIQPTNEIAQKADALRAEGYSEDQIAKALGAYIEPQGAQTELGQLKADLDARRITPEQYQAGVRKATQLAQGTTINIDAKPITDTQAQSLGFADRAAAAENIVGELFKSGYAPSKVEENLRDIPAVGNYLVSDSTRRFEGAKLDFISAVLRKESGAVIDYSPGGEYDRENKKYFPQPGDDAKTIADKTRRRTQAISNLRREGRPVTGSEAAATTDAPSTTFTDQQIAKPETQADYDKIPSGSRYLDPGDGLIHIKP